MARGSDRSSRRSPKDAGRKTKKKPCALCRDKIEWVDYKDVGLLRKYMSDRGKIRARRVTGNCTQHQRDVALAIKTARELVLLPYTQRTMTERAGGRTRTRVERGERPAERGSPGGDDARRRGPSPSAGAEARRAGSPSAGQPATATATGDESMARVATGDEASGAESEEAGVSGNGAGIEASAAPGDEAPAAGNGSAGRDVIGDGA